MRVLAQDELRIIIQMEIQGLIPSVLRQLEPPKISLFLTRRQDTDARGAPGSDVGAATETADRETLSMARTFAAKGRIEASISCYSQFIHANPNRIDVRIEYINMLLSAGLKSKARVAVIDALKHRLTAPERDALWQLFQKCAMDKQPGG